jgi:hypothetical protein
LSGCPHRTWRGQKRCCPRQLKLFVIDRIEENLLQILDLPLFNGQGGLAKLLKAVLNQVLEAQMTETLGAA